MRRLFGNVNGMWQFPTGWRLRRAVWRRKASNAPKFANDILETENRKSALKLGAIVMFSTFAIGMAAVWAVPQLLPEQVSLSSDPTQPRMALCGAGMRETCVVDGDTIWLRGEKIRVADIDTPEVSSPKCDYEYQLGMRATYRLRDLLNQGPWSIEPIGSRDEDGYGRKLRVLTRNGQSIGDMLVSEGLARTWTGRREPWC